ncbi:MAG: YigZ family protein [Anaerococcus vaginalis]|uniref:YigZ family protein n=1 Tax=Anaerococcus vaginalis TaxID=33037 RepID=UPI00288A5FC3|nr:YigZ family protein [Anaerococcus vaginalis]MDU4378467.1 YigZ family protein [Anaerococcus vaginalis]MDU5823866.1 YigZ family protein [Anaerococcus vaginalis]
MKYISRKISENYKTIKGEINDEFEIEKSIFITNMKYVESEKDALSFIEKIKEKYKDANHNCHAYIINEKPEIKRYSDDGEPQGSAGLPMLSVLEKENLFNVVAIVTRYFGGKKLGKGGLVRAYTRGVSDCLDGYITCRKIFVESKIIFDYNLLGIIENFLNEEKYIIIEKDFLENVRINLYIKKEDFEKIEKKLIDMTSSNIKIEKIDEIMLYED